MELMTKQGYKQTEVGLIPEDWGQPKYLNEILSEMTDFVAAGSFESLRENVSVYDSDNYAFYVRLVDIRAGIGHIKQKFVDKISFDFLKRSNLFGGEILIANIGANVGEVFIMPKVNKPATIAPNMILMRTNEAILDSKFCYYFIDSNIGQNLLYELIAGSGHPKLNKTDLKKLLIPLPPTLTEQKAIATALSDVDALIASLEQTITKKKAIKQGAMQQLLTPPHKGGKRLPGFSGEWVEKTLGEMFDFKTATSKKQFFDLFGDLIVMDMGSVSIKGEILKSKRANCDFDILKRDDLVMPKDDIGGGNIIGKVAYIDKDNFYVLSDHVFRLRPLDDKIDSLYFSYLINSSVVNETILKVVSGSAQLGLGLNIIKHLTVYYNLDNQQQKAIAQILSDMDAEITQLESKKSKYQAIKQGMMQELLTGKTRLV